MTASPLAGLAERPPSEVEWEDLLVRLEVTPRALRLAVEDAGGDSPGLRARLHEVLGQEMWWGEVLMQLRAGAPVSMNRAVPQLMAEGGEPDAGELARAFANLRERNFAQVQRRGLEVWSWKSAVDGGSETLTAYQALQLMARMDGETLAALRAGGRG